MKKILAFGLIFLSLNALTQVDNFKVEGMSVQKNDRELRKNKTEMTEAQYENYIENNFLGKSITFTSVINNVERNFFGGYYYVTFKELPSMLDIEVIKVEKNTALSLKKGSNVTVRGKIKKARSTCNLLCLEVNEATFK